MFLIDVQQHAWDVRSSFTLLWTVLEVVCFHEAFGVEVARIYNMCCQSGAVLQEELSFLAARQPSMRQVLACVKHVRGRSRHEDSNKCASQCKEAMCNTLHMHPHPTVGKNASPTPVAVSCTKGVGRLGGINVQRRLLCAASHSFRNLGHVPLCHR